MPSPAGDIVIKTLHCEFVRNSAVTSKLILQDRFDADRDYILSGFHFSTAIFNRSTVTCGAWLIINNVPVLDFSNAAGVRLLGSQCLVRSSALGVNQLAHRSEWVTLDHGIPIADGQTIGLYAFASNLNTQSTFATIALALNRA